MNEQIEALSAEQAQRALLLFYDLLPGTLWEDGQKPSSADIDAWADELQEETSQEARDFLQTLQSPENATQRAEPAKKLLVYFAQYPPFVPYIEQALERTREPHMMPIPVLIAPLITFLTSMQFEIDVDSKTDGTKKEVHTHISIKRNPSAHKLIDKTVKLRTMLRPVGRLAEGHGAGYVLCPVQRVYDV